MLRYNGVDLATIHKAVSLSSAGPGGWSRDIRRIETGQGGLVAYARDEGATYHAVVNISARTVDEGKEALQAVRSWARGTGGMGEIDPHGEDGYAYDGMLLSVEEPDWQHGFGTVRVEWLLDSPHRRSVQESRATTAAATELCFRVSGTAAAYATFEVSPVTDQATLTVQLDGRPLVLRNQKTTGGRVLVIDTQHEKLTIGTTDVTAQTDWSQTSYDHPLERGEHVLTCSAEARLTARWHDRWA